MWYYLEKIRRIFNKNNINISFKTSNFNKKLLQNKEQTIDKMNCSGIYAITCDCGSKYVGKTTRKFKQRFYEHKYSFIHNKPEKSTVAAHLLKYNHILNPNSFNIVKIINNKKLISTWENFEIYKTFKDGNVMNEQIPETHNLLYNTLLSIT